METPGEIESAAITEKMVEHKVIEEDEEEMRVELKDEEDAEIKEEKIDEEKETQEE